MSPNSTRVHDAMFPSPNPNPHQLHQTRLVELMQTGYTSTEASKILEDQHDQRLRMAKSLIEAGHTAQEAVDIVKPDYPEATKKYLEQSTSRSDTDR